ncbi:MAG TPA: SDR family oxidoreductase [Acidobacteriaceae bacterium]|jgi:NAD(P)-dependent dehydrogenase (short-subunit alcohol dehydrogenase family)|nr:SDR family oxidoreductase [Acidobacteriaceae bacterium]
MNPLSHHSGDPPPDADVALQGGAYPRVNSLPSVHRNGTLLLGKTAIVTGAASGIGQAIALRLAAQGATVCPLDVHAERLEATAAQIAAGENPGLPLVCDVRDAVAVRCAVEKVTAQRSIDILINSAGIPSIGRLDSTSAEEFDRTFAVNVKGVFHCMQAVIEPMRRNGGGVILNLASIAATAGLSDRFAYSMSKGAVLSMTYSVARDYLHDGIRCNAISPARIHTPFVDAFLRQHYPGQEKAMFARLEQAQPIGRMGLPEEVAALAAFLCSDEASFITGADLPCDGGFFTLRG